MPVPHQLITAGDLTVCYETFGDPDDPALLLVMGLGVQLTSWESEFCEAFAAEGFHVIRYDNRDVGLSSSLPGARYTLSDMAADGINLLTALGIEQAHVLGVSLGGMLAQLMTIEHPERVLSLCSIMSTTGAPGVNEATRTAIEIIGRAVELPRDEAVAEAVERARFLAGSAFPFDEDRIRRRAAAGYDRANNPDGKARQREAARTATDRTEGLRGVKVPTVVIHGDADPVLTVSAGRATAAAVPGARLVVLEGMGHELPRDVEARIIAETVKNAESAGFRRASRR